MQMSKPIFHAQSSVKKYGGKVEDYIEIHNFMDSSKGAIPDNRHRALTHNSWFLSVVLERVFGVSFLNSEGKTIATRDIGEQHVLEDFGMRFIPTAQDYLEEINFKDWMNNGRVGTPSSHRRIHETKVTKKIVERPQVFDGSAKHLFDSSKVNAVVDASEKAIESSFAKPMTFD